MGFLENLAKAAIRKTVVEALRKDCPAALAPALEQLLADNGAVGAIQDWVGSCLQNPQGITVEALKALPLPAAAKELLGNVPGLADYLVAVAHAKIKR